MSISEAYDNWSGQYDSNHNKTRDLDELATKKMLSNLEFESVLELGCGTGKNTIWLNQYASRIVAVDFSEKMMAVAQEKLNDTSVRFQQADITKKWDWDSSRFDLLTCSLILEHIKDLDFIFSEAADKIVSGGYFFISELHPIKQYTGSKARYETDNGIEELEVFIHHVSEYIEAAEKAGLKMLRLKEWFDDNVYEIPRLINFIFQKP